MSTSTKDGGPAFPVSTQGRNEDAGPYGHQDGPQTWQFPGITIRDYFAAKAMQAMLTATSADSDLPNLEYRRVSDGPTVAERLSTTAYDVADAMLRARED